MERLNREQVLAFRQHRQFLSSRAAPDQLGQVAALGIQNSPPDSALLAAGARLQDFSQEQFEQALYTHKTLIQCWSLRSAPYIMPVQDIPVFTTGISPTNEEECLFIMRGAAAHLKKFDLSALQVCEWTTRAVESTFTGSPALNKDESGIRLSNYVRRFIPVYQHTAWDEPDGIGENTFGQSLVRYALSVVSLSGMICFASSVAGHAARFTLTENWLGQSAPEMDAPLARAELVRRFLHYYGPGDAKKFASWAGVSPEFAQNSWSLISTELTPVSLDKRQLWMLERDVEVIHAAQLSPGVHLLPPHDPYLSAADKDLLVPDQAARRRIWRTVGNPGVVLISGEVAGIWHPRKKGRVLSIEIELFIQLPEPVRASIEAAAQRTATLRQTQLTSLEFV